MIASMVETGPGAAFRASFRAGASGPHSRFLPALACLAASVLALGAAMAARPLGALPPAASVLIPGLVVNPLLGVLSAAVFLYLVLLVVVLWPSPHDDDTPMTDQRTRLPWWVRALIMTVPFMLLVAVVARSHTAVLPPAVVTAPPQLAPASDTPTGTVQLADPDGSVVLFAVVTAGLIAGLAAWRLPRRAGPPPAVRPELLATLQEAVAGAEFEMDAEDDPRLAIIGAYARMERVLGDAGYRRRPFEAPLEFLSRLLSEGAAASEAVTQLTGLFELAKFSQHDIGPEMREAAQTALARVRIAVGYALEDLASAGG
jgi:hypothetical protein